MANETGYASGALVGAVVSDRALELNKALYRDNLANAQEATMRELVAKKEAEYHETGYSDKITIYRSADKQWRWKRVAPNGEIVGASSEAYRAYSACRKNMQRQHTPCDIAEVEVED